MSEDANTVVNRILRVCRLVLCFWDSKAEGFSVVRVGDVEVEL